MLTQPHIQQQIIQRKSSPRDSAVERMGEQSSRLQDATGAAPCAVQGSGSLSHVQAGGTLRPLTPPLPSHPRNPEPPQPGGTGRGHGWLPDPCCWLRTQPPRRCATGKGGQLSGSPSACPCCSLLSPYDMPGQGTREPLDSENEGFCLCPSFCAFPHLIYTQKQSLNPGPPQRTGRRGSQAMLG